MWTSKLLSGTPASAPVFSGSLIESSLPTPRTLLGFPGVALSDEQNAMLRLLASGEQGYDDIAALMGLSVTEVRAKVVGALAQLEAEGKPVPDVPSPVAGGAKPAGRAAAPDPEPATEPTEPQAAAADPAETTPGTPKQ